MLLWRLPKLVGKLVGQGRLLQALPKQVVLGLLLLQLLLLLLLLPGRLMLGLNSAR